jgi:hypothetical protein
MHLLKGLSTRADRFRNAIPGFSDGLFPQIWRLFHSLSADAGTFA